tara:strand:- start:246 stop:839 length:594 start_codon:yes stop_codon:yes gene_type:complete
MVVMQMEKQIIVCYLRASSTVLEDHILNRLAALFAPRSENPADSAIVHVELYFPDDSNRDTGLSAGIHYGGQMFMYPKSFRRSDWTFHSIPATQRQVTLAKAFCERQRGAPFNYAGFFMPQPCNIGHGYRMRNMDSARMPWYCSELVAYTLMHAGILDTGATLRARVHPQSSYDVIQEQCATYMDCARSLKGDILKL